MTIIFFALKGAWHDLYKTFFVFLPEYTRLSSQHFPFSRSLFHVLPQWIVSFSFVNLIWIVILFILPSINPKENEGEIHLSGYVVFQLVGIAFQAKFFPYHYEAALAFTGLLAG